MIKNRTAILALLTGLNFLNYIDRTILAAVLVHLKADLDLSYTEAGLGASAFLIGYFLTAPFFGARADRGSRTGLIAGGVLVWSIATVLTGFATSLGTFLLARVFVGLGEASYATLAPTIIDDLTPPDKKGKALAVFYLAIPLGSALGYMIGGAIDKHWGWRAAFYVAGGPGVLLALSCLLIVDPPRKLAAAKAKLAEGLRVLASIPLFRRAVIGYCAYTAGIGAFAYWAPDFLVRRFPDYLDTQSAGFWFGLITVIGGAVGTVIGGTWGDRGQRGLPKITENTPWDSNANKLGINVLLRVSAIGMVIAVPFTAASFFMPLPVVFFALAFVAEIGLFLSTSPVNAIGLRAVPPELRASAMAAMIFAIHLFGDLWSPPALGLLRDHLHVAMNASPHDPLPTTIAMMVLPITFALSAYVWWPRRREAA
jgi:MFS family permease